jgi:Tfp pilus assembly protein PilE
MTYPSSLFNDRGMSLAELLISTIIVGFMVTGIFTAYNNLQGMDRGASRRAAISMEIQSVTEHMRHNAVMAIGTSLKPGVAVNNTADDTNYVCFRQDVSTTPQNLSDDRWRCYTWLGAPRVNVYFCSSAIGGAPGACAATDLLIGQAYNTQSAVWDPTTGLFSIWIIDRYDLSAAVALDGLGNPTQGNETNPQSYFRLVVHPDAQSSN